MKFAIGPRVFLSKAAARAAVQDILRSHMEGDDLIGDERVLIGDLFEMHPEAAAKARPGIAGFGVRYNCRDGIGSAGFHVLHPNGFSTAWSYLVAFNNNLSAPTITAAMRGAILLSQVKFLRDAFGNQDYLPCANCRKRIARKDAHADHLPPTFAVLAAQFLAMHGEPAVVSDPNWGDTFADLTIQTAWRAFHDAHAIRRIVCAPCNLSAKHAARNAC